MSIEDIKKELEKKTDKLGFLKEKLTQETIADVKSEIRKLYVEELMKKALVKLETQETAEFKLVYDSLSEGLEPIYFWTLDFMRDDEPSGLGLEVTKVEEAFESSVGSGYFGELGARSSIMEDRAMKMLQTVNTVVRSIINLIYDLKEFEIRLASYDKLKSQDIVEREAGELELKGVWMDQVDTQKGRGSMNLLAQQLQFVTLRDAFMVSKDLEHINQLDLNDRVKNILKRKFSEYLDWKKMSEVELRKRKNIERAYLKSQVTSLKLYTKWARPYLRAAQKLRMKEFNSPDVVSAFSNVQMELSLFGKKEIKPNSVFEEYAKIKFDKKYYFGVFVDFKFRSVPQSIRTQGGSQYIHAGNTELIFRSYVFTNDELDELEKQELYEDMDLVEDLTNVSLKELQEDLDKYLKGEEEKPIEQKKKTYKLKIPVIGAAFTGFKEITRGIFTGLLETLRIRKAGPGYIEKQIRTRAAETALKSALLVYTVYKKTHGMLAW